MSNNPKPARVFVSHSSADRAFDFAATRERVAARLPEDQPRQTSKAQQDLDVGRPIPNERLKIR